MELIWELQMDVEYSYLGREKDAFNSCVSYRNSFFAKDIGYKHIKWLSKLHTVNPRISAQGAYFKFMRRRGALDWAGRRLIRGGANSRIYVIDLWKLNSNGFIL